MMNSIVLRNKSTQTQSVRLNAAAEKEEMESGATLKFDVQQGKNYLGSYPEIFEEVEAISGDYALEDEDWKQKIDVLESVLKTFKLSAPTKKELTDLLAEEKAAKKAHFDGIRKEEAQKQKQTDADLKARQDELDRQAKLDKAKAAEAKKIEDKRIKDMAERDAAAQKEAEETKAKEEAEKKAAEDALLAKAEGTEGAETAPEKTPEEIEAEKKAAEEKAEIEKKAAEAAAKNKTGSTVKGGGKK